MLILKGIKDMGRPPQTHVRLLSEEEAAELERLARATSVRADQQQRARAVLAVQQGQGFTQAAAAAGFRSGDSVALLVRRFNVQGLRALVIAPGRGRKATYTPVARAQIVACAQRSPDRTEDGGATWSLSLLQRALRGGGLPTVSRDTIRRVLQDAGSSYQRTRTWCPTGTALRKRKAGWVTVTDPDTEEKKR